MRVAPDTLQLTFHLRRDVRWHDRVPTTADDIVFTFERSIDPLTASPHVDMYRLYDPRAERVDSFTVRFRVRASAGFLLPWITRPPVPRHLLGAARPEDLRRHPYGQQPVGNGPFRLLRPTPGQEWVFEANPDYRSATSARRGACSPKHHGWIAITMACSRNSAGRPFRFTLLFPTASDSWRTAAVIAQAPLREAGVDAQLRAVELNYSLRFTIDAAAAAPLWREYQLLLAREQPYTVLYYPKLLFGVRHELEGVEMDSRGYLVAVSRWWRVAR